ncbi:MAG: hypothetical protein QNI86_14775 [Halieaceae bacterium]|nr:hypothetical protein [Halieaceae bacterium]
MTVSRHIVPALIFAAGLLAGLGIDRLVPEAQASEVNWQQVAQDPEFRAAVVEVINACIVENGIIFCN